MNFRTLFSKSFTENNSRGPLIQFWDFGYNINYFLQFLRILSCIRYSLAPDIPPLVEGSAM